MRNTPAIFRLHVIMNGHRDWGGPSEEHQPITWLHGYGLYAVHFIVVAYIATMFLTTLMMATRLGGLLQWLPFQSDLVLKGQIWRFLTYGLVNPPSLQFVIDMFMIVWFGRELEKFFGRRTFLFFYGSLYVLAPVLYLLLSFWQPMTLSGEFGGFALFIGFATLLPNVALLFGILAKWFAIVLVGIFTMIHLAGNNWVGLVTLWGTVGFAYGFVRYQQGLLALPKFRLWRRKPKLRVLPTPPVKKPVEVAKPKADTTMAEVDALLDKIATSGMSSLTPKERAKLEAARADLMKRASQRE
jgi:hypothetical protein